VETGNGTKTPVVEAETLFLSLSPLWRKKKISSRLIEIIVNRAYRSSRSSRDLDQHHHRHRYRRTHIGSEKWKSDRRGRIRSGFIVYKERERKTYLNNRKIGKNI